jgi:hypothetical protein
MSFVFRNLYVFNPIPYQWLSRMGFTYMTITSFKRVSNNRFAYDIGTFY